MTLTEGLVYSKNTITAQLIAEVGPRHVARLAHAMGIESPLEAVPSLALGTSDVSLLEMTTAYATLAAGGRYHEPLPVTRIENARGDVVAVFSGSGRRALDRTTAQTVVHMMRGVIDRGTGRGIRSQFGIDADVAGKTGTTQNSADGWFLLMHPSLVVGAWVGFDSPRVTFRSNYWGQGAHNALFVVGDFFRQAEASLPNEQFPTPRRYEEPGSIFDRAERWFSGFWGEDSTATYTTDPYADSLYYSDYTFSEDEDPQGEDSLDFETEMTRAMQRDSSRRSRRDTLPTRTDRRSITQPDTATSYTLPPPPSQNIEEPEPVVNEEEQEVPVPEPPAPEPAEPEPPAEEAESPYPEESAVEQLYEETGETPPDSSRQ